jgi:hypothetical protein
MPNPPTANDFPGLFEAADAIAAESQKMYKVLMTFYLLLLIVGSLLTLFIEKCSWFPFYAALAFLASLLLSIWLAFRRYDRTWYSARAVAESVKTRTWRFGMNAEPYSTLQTDAAAEQRFLEDLQQILQQNREVTKECAHESATNDPISDWMRSLRKLPLNERMAFYKNERVANQQKWYSDKSLTNKANSRRWFITMVLLQVGAIVCLLLRVRKPEWTLLPTEVFAVAASSAMSWIQMNRFNDLATSYSLATHEISIILGRMQSINSEQGFATFVTDTEGAFSREHTQWVARTEA